MLLKANLQEAVRGLSTARQRSLLALIGIVIGISSVIAMITVGMIVKGEAVKQFQKLGTDTVTVYKISRDSGSRRGAGATIGLADALALTTLSTIDLSAPYLTSRGQVFLAGKVATQAHLIGATAAFGEINRLHVTAGRFISDLDYRRYYCVIGSEIADALRDTGVGRLVGTSLKIDDALYTVVGVLPSGLRGPREIRMSRAVLIPLTTAQRVFGHTDVRQITARMPPNVHYLAAAAQVRAYFRRKSAALDVRVESPEQLIEQMHKQMRLFTLLLGTVGGISLLLGGIGIMNVMLVAVSERRLEIGIRRALGARRRDIQWQFLTESLILSLLGGIFGVALGVGATSLICSFAGWTFLVSPRAIGLGVSVAAGAGIFFGSYPAYQAARLDPIAALRGQ